MSRRIVIEEPCSIPGHDFWCEEGSTRTVLEGIPEEWVEAVAIRMHKRNAFEQFWMGWDETTDEIRNGMRSMARGDLAAAVFGETP